MGTVAVFQLIDSSTCCLTHQLVTHTDTADGFATHRHLFLQDIDSLNTTVWIARTISQKQSVELHIGIVVVPGHTNHLHSATYQTADDVLLHTAVNQHHASACSFVIFNNVFARNLLHPVYVLVCRERVAAHRAFELQAAHHHAVLTQHLRQLAGINAGNSWHLLTLQPVAQTLAGIPVAIRFAIVADNDCRGINPVALHKRGQSVVLHRKRRHSVVSHQRIGQHHQLTGIARVGQTFRIAHHGGVEHHLTSHWGIIAEALALEFRSII